MKYFFNQTTNFGLFLFITLAIYNLFIDVREDLSALEKIETIQTQLHRIDANSEIVLELQRERGLTNIYFANPTDEHKEKMFVQREKSSKSLTSISPELIKSLKEIREQVDSIGTQREYIFNYYSELVRNLLLDTRSLTYDSDDKILKNELAIYNELNSLQEILGQLRAKVGLVLSSNRYAEVEANDITRSNTLFQHQLETTFVNDILSSRNYTKKISKTKCLKKSFLISKTLEMELLKGEKRLSAIEWFKISTCAIDKINSYVNEQLKIVNEHIEKKIDNLNKQRLNGLVFWLFGFVILAIYVFIAFRRSNELSKEQAMLRNYKKAIDYSSMVVRSNSDGLITHVNNNLRERSGYKENELLGKRQDVIVDKDTSKEILFDMRRHMLGNRVYSGIVKNRTKDGSSFWSDTFIIPILDNQDKIVEYITIGCDISEILTLNNEVLDTQRELLYRLGEAVESRNKDSGNHIKRVAHFSKLLAQLSNLSDEECDVVFAASSMHDIGKVAIPDHILLKPAKLSEEEWGIMKTHSEIGYKLFKDSKRPLLVAAANIAHEHHEFYNGKGYPRGLKDEEISIFGRIVAIADVFDALYSKRPYKEPWELEKILKLFKEEAGEQFDPLLVELFIENVDKFVEIQNNYTDA